MIELLRVLLIWLLAAGVGIVIGVFVWWWTYDRHIYNTSFWDMFPPLFKND